MERCSALFIVTDALGKSVPYSKLSNALLYETDEFGRVKEKKPEDAFLHPLKRDLMRGIGVWVNKHFCQHFTGCVAKLGWSVHQFHQTI